MNARAAHQFTRNRIVFGDMLLNWFLGVVLTFLPAFADSILGRSLLIPLWLYRLVGLGFLLFAAWQTFHVVRHQMGPGALVFAAWAAEIPVVMLTVALVALKLPLRPGARFALWVGDVYMLFLGGWYFYLARLLSRDAENTTHVPEETNPGR